MRIPRTTPRWPRRLAQSALVLLTACGGGGPSGGGEEIVNQAPAVSAGASRSVADGTNVTLSGTASDPDGTVATVGWTQVGGSPQVQLQGAGTATATFIAPFLAPNQLLTLSFAFEATDDEGLTSSDTVHITITWRDFFLYLVDSTPGVFELWRAEVGPSAGPPIRLSDSLVEDGDVHLHRLSPDGTRVVYEADQDVDDVYGLYMTSTAGSSKPVKVSALPYRGTASSRSWSPDGAYFTYRASPGTDRASELYCVRADGTQHVRLNDDLAPGGHVFTYRWAPDSSCIVYVADQDADDRIELYAVRPDGSGRVELGGPWKAGTHYGTLQWAPDSSSVAFTTLILDSSGLEAETLYTVRPDGSDLVRLSEEGAVPGVHWHWAWLPDASRLVYRFADTPLNEDLYSVGPDGTDLTMLNGPRVAGGQIKAFFVAPDGSRIAYTGDQDTDDVTELYLVMPDGTARHKINDPLTADADVRQIEWSPNSTALSYTIRRNGPGDLYVYEPARGRQILPVHVKVTESVEPGAAGVGIWLNNVWAPDGSYVTYVTQREVDQPRELRAARIGSRGIVTRFTLNDPPVGGSPVVGNFLWTPDATRVVYQASEVTGEMRDLFSVRPDGTDRMRITPLLEVGSELTFLYSVGSPWSSGGDYLAFRLDRPDDGGFALYIVDPSGGRPARRVAESPSSTPDNEDPDEDSGFRSIRWRPRP